MSKKGIGFKLANVPIAKLRNPQGGIFAGRDIPKSRLDDPNWLRVLELKKPPSEGLYIPRNSLVVPAKKPIKKKGLLYKIAKAMVDYERAGMPKPHHQGNGGAAGMLKSKPGTHYEIPHVDDWNKLSPDIESSYLGLEQLEKGEKLTIIGAGITGLTLAWILNRARPDVKIEVVDSQPDVGGWMQSRIVDVGDGNSTLFESGPRTLLPSHPGSEVITRILYEIGKRDELLAGVPRDSATNRKGLMFNGEVVQLPASWPETLKFLTTGPLLKGAKWRMLKDLWEPARSVNVDDESVRSFVSRRVGPLVADRMVSAIMRGIYAADYSQLSARSVARLNRFYYLERTEKMSMIAAVASGSAGFLDHYARDALPLVFDALAPPASTTNVEARQLTNREHPRAKFSLYGFKSGIQSAARAIADDLRTRTNVQIRLNTRVTRVEPETARTVKLHYAGGTAHEATNVVVSTVATPSMFERTNAKLADDIRQVKYSSLAVVNVWVPDPTAAKDWFGILVPKTEDDWNRDGVLGVIFDSSVRNAMKPNKEDHERGSSMTVMIGGDLWNENMTEEDAKRIALNGLKRMKLVPDTLQVKDTIMQAALQRNAIPKYEVGHSKLQHRVAAELQQTYHGRVALIGMAFGRGCGVSDCVVDALTIALRFSEQRKLLHPEFFFNHWWSATRPEYYA